MSEKGIINIWSLKTNVLGHRKQSQNDSILNYQAHRQAFSVNRFSIAKWNVFLIVLNILHKIHASIIFISKAVEWARGL